MEFRHVSLHGCWLSPKGCELIRLGWSKKKTLELTSHKDILCIFLPSRTLKGRGGDSYDILL